MQRFLLYLALILATIFWSISYIWYKVIYEAYTPAIVLFFRLLIASLFLVFFSAVMRKLQKLRKGDVYWFLLMAFFEPLLYFTGESFGMLYVSATVGAVIISMIPVFVPLIMLIFYKQKIVLINLLGVLVSIAGVYMVLVNEQMALTASVKGMLFMFLAVAAALGYTVLLHRMVAKYNAYTIITWQNVFAAVYFIPVFLLSDFQLFISTPVDVSAFLRIAGLAVFASSLAYIFYAEGVKRLGATKATVFTNLVPVSTAVLAYYILNERLAYINIGGIVLVIVGLFLSQVNRRLWRWR